MQSFDLEKQPKKKASRSFFSPSRDWLMPPFAARTPSSTVLFWVKALVFLACLLPFGVLVYDFFTHNLGVNPVETLEHQTGLWALRLMLITLAITPLRKLSSLNGLTRLRRMLGLYAFFYAALHLTAYLWFDQGFELSAILNDIMDRPFITVGFAAIVLMTPLALTSFNAAMRWMGGKRWQLLHRLTYCVALLGVVHYWWLVKIDVRAPMIYAGVLAVLLGMRVRWWVEKTKTKTKR